MFYRTEQASGLPRDPWNMCVMPRPIGWISSMNAQGVLNLAPYSFFNAVAEDPPMVMFATNGHHPHGLKDTAANVRSTKEFVCSMATKAFIEAVRITSEPSSPETNEFVLAGLETEPSILVRPPRVKGSPIHLECEFVMEVQLPTGGETNIMTIGRVLGINIDDRVLKNGLVDVCSVEPLGRLGYGQFSVVNERFPLVPLRAKRGNDTESEIGLSKGNPRSESGTQ